MKYLWFRKALLTMNDHRAIDSIDTLASKSIYKGGGSRTIERVGRVEE